MRKLLLLLPVLLCALGASAQIMLDQTSMVTFTDCASGGSVAQSITQGTYLLTVDGEAVFLCQAASGATCASGGTKFSAGFGMLFYVPQGGFSLACRSAGATGDIQFTRKGN